MPKNATLSPLNKGRRPKNRPDPSAGDVSRLLYDIGTPPTITRRQRLLGRSVAGMTDADRVYLELVDLAEAYPAVVPLMPAMLRQIIREEGR